MGIKDYKWDWGDGNQSDWLGPFDSGAQATAEKSWSVKGQYNIKVKAKDTKGAESTWSDSLPITMPAGRYFEPMGFLARFIELLQQFIQRIFK